MFAGARYFFIGLGLIIKPGIRRFVVIPLIINVVIFSAVLWLGSRWFDQFLDKMLPTWLSWAEFILWPLFALSYFLLLFYLFALLVNVIAAPFNDLLAEKVEQYLRGSTATESTDHNFWLEIPRSIANEIGKLLYFLLRSIPLLILFVIPGVNLFAPLVWFVFSAWILSLEYLDYPCSNHNITFKDTRAKIRNNRLTCISFGSAVTGFTMLPIINFIAMPAAVAGATKLYLEELEST